MDRCEICGTDRNLERPGLEGYERICTPCLYEVERHHEWLDREAAEGIRPYPDKTELLIVHPVSYRRNEEMPDGWETVTKDLSRYTVGERIVHEAGAPGIGRTIYIITRIDGDGVWGLVEEDTVRVMEPWEVE